MISRWKAGVFATLGLLSAETSRAALPEAARMAWLEARSPRFRVLSNAGEDAAVRAARHLERLADAIAFTTTGLRVDGGREVRAYVFQNGTSFHPYGPARTRSEDERDGVTAGFHVSGGDVELIAWFVPPDGSLRFASHEYLHAVTERSLGRLPLWASEGIAEYFSTFQDLRGGADLGNPIPEHLASLRSQSLDMNELLRISHNSPEYHAGPHRGTFYAQSWALVHMMIMAPDRGAALSRVLAALARGRTSEAALTEVLGPRAVDSLGIALHEYVRQSSLRSRRLDYGAQAENVSVQVRALTPAEALTALGEILTRSEDAERPAREHLLEAWRLDSTRALPAALLVHLSLENGDAGEGERWLRAIRLSSDTDPRPWALAGQALVDRWFRSVGPLNDDAGAAAGVLEARAWLRRALDRRPETAEWMVPFGMTFLLSEQDSLGISEGIAALMTARESWPRDPSIAGALSILLLRSGNRAAALHLYRSVPAGLNETYWRTASGIQIGLDVLQEARRVAAAGRIAEAETLVTRLARDVPEEFVRGECARLLAELRGRAPFAADRTGGGSSSEPAGPSARGAARPTGSSAEARAAAALAGGDYLVAEKLYREAAGSGGSARTVARLDSMAAHARNLRRRDVAERLASMGRTAEACSLYGLILGDRPRAALRREVEQKRRRLCFP